METNQGQNKTQEFLQKNKNYLAAGFIILLLIIYFAARDNNNSGESEEKQNTEQNADSAKENEKESNDAKEDSDSSESNNDSKKDDSTNFKITGILKASDKLSSGNYVIDTSSGKIYLKTQRNYTSITGKQVTLEAVGDINSFTGAIITEGATSPANPVIKTSKPADTSAIKVIGTLQKSDNSIKGNYIINSSQGKIYLKTSRDYSSWVGSQVTLEATGNINNFTGARLIKL